ncbi:hypothetical protein AM588_10001288 [Phytophthora nicotianae]|uniref:RxLR effector protein n=1 Tax=Phytophthora nicotianae TaxID=4792 RepID=A0A0W8CSJ1_PHYNI|nr:hypothetical protein AM588_10001288 [Phytophthora nicotianae]
MVSSLAAHYGDVAVAKMLTEAKKTSHATATTFINAQLTNWHIKEQSADDVFKLLRLHEKGEKLFEDSLVSTWILYVTKLNKDKASELMFKSLKTHYSDEVLAKLIVAARSDYKFRQYAVKWQDLQLVNWLNSGQTSKPGELRVIMELEKRYTSMELARMIVAAMKNGTGEMKTLASDLQELLFKHWLAKKLNPQFVVALMGTTDDWQNLKVILNYTDFYRKIEAA